MSRSKPRKPWEKADILRLFEREPRSVDRALVAIYRLQTSEEQQGYHSGESNGVGFTRHDALVLTRYASDCIRNGGLDGKTRAIVKQRVKKYWKQLADIANRRVELTGGPLPVDYDYAPPGPVVTRTPTHQGESR